jgi:hypothetical protein
VEGQEPSIAPPVLQFNFLEVSFMMPKLSMALSDLAGSSVTCWTLRPPFAKIDISLDASFTLLLDSLAHWIHLSPGCGTFSKARRSDAFAKVKPLRSALRPMGFGCKKTKAANLVVDRMCHLATKMVSCGKYFSFIGPRDS